MDCPPRSQKISTLKNYRNVTEREEKSQQVWSRVSSECPEFTHSMDPMNDPWAVEALLFGNQINTKRFPGGNVLDIGANVGILSAYWASTGSNVVAYEADPMTFELLNNMVIRTGLNIMPVNKAIWTYNGQVEFNGASHIDREREIRGGCLWVPLRPQGFYENPAAKFYTVDCITLKEALGDTVWDCVKMDIEGAEFEVLASTDIEIMQRQIKYMQLEFHNGWATDAQYNDLIKKLQSAFTIDGVSDSNGRLMWAHLINKNLD